MGRVEETASLWLASLRLASSWFSCIEQSSFIERPRSGCSHVEMADTTGVETLQAEMASCTPHSERHAGSPACGALEQNLQQCRHRPVLPTARPASSGTASASAAEEEVVIQLDPLVVGSTRTKNGHETGLQKADVDATALEVQLSTSSIRHGTRGGQPRPKRGDIEPSIPSRLEETV